MPTPFGGSTPRRMLLQVCVNGARPVAQHPWLSADPSVVAVDAARAVDAGAQEVHLHPKDAEGLDSVAPDDVARWVRAVRAVCPDVPLGVTTGEWAELDVERRVAAIEAWTELPDFASVNWHEAGADAVATALHARGVAVEAGIWDGAGLDAWRRSTAPGAYRRVLIELPDDAAGEVRAHAQGLIAHVTRVKPGVPILLHGEDRSAWPAVDLAAAWHLDTRIGLEDCLTLPDGRTAIGNAALVRAALARMRAGARGAGVRGPVPDASSKPHRPGLNAMRFRPATAPTTRRPTPARPR